MKETKKFFGVEIKDTPAMLVICNTKDSDFLECITNTAIRDGAWRKDKEYAKLCIKQLREARANESK